MNFGSFGRTKGKRKRDRGEGEDAAAAKPVPETAKAEPAKSQTEQEMIEAAVAAAEKESGAPVAPAGSPAAELLSDDEPKKQRFAWFRKFSARQKIIIALCLAMVGLAIFAPRKGKKPTANSGDVPQRNAPTASSKPNAGKQSQSGTQTTGGNSGDDLDPDAGTSSAAGGGIPSRVDSDAASKPPPRSGLPVQPAEKPGVPGAYQRETARPMRPSGTASSGTESASASTEATGTPPGAAAGAPRGVNLPPPSGKAAVLREILRMEGEPPKAPPMPTQEAAAAVQTASATPTRSNSQASQAQPADEPEFAPYGRLIKCRLVFTVDSMMTGAPIIAIVTEDLSWNGVLIIPANTELFSTAMGVKADVNGLGRILDAGDWVMVLPEYYGRTNGREMRIKGKALDRREVLVDGRGAPRSWGLDDGSIGLQGDTIRTMQREEIYRFAAAAISGLSKGLSETLQDREAAPGIGGMLGQTQPKPTMRNAVIGGLGEGAKADLDLYVQKITAEIEKNGAYVRVASGKEFYVFVEQTLDPLSARIGLTAVASGQAAARTASAPSP